MSSTFFAGQSTYLARLNRLADATGLRNLVINGDFRFWQRGTSFSAATTNRVTADRFRCNGSAAGTSAQSRSAFTVGQTAVPGEPQYYMTVVRSVAAGAANEIVSQYIEDVRYTAGREVTFALWAKVASGSKTLNLRITQYFGSGGSPSANVSVANPNITVTTTWTKFSVTATCPSISGKTIGTNNDSALIVKLEEPSSFGTFTVDTALWQLEYGDSATDFEWVPYDIQFLRCLRYYQKSFPQETTPAQNAGVTGAVQCISQVNSVAFQYFKELYPRMRAAPTVTLYNPSAANANWRDTTASSDRTAFADPTATSDSFGITHGAVGTAGNIIRIHYTLDAEF